ncbi:hypothetical protein C4J81_04650 [Deltaproteobacteria bacterium Smac51]|nr:hypothetical protein C4J81_04650 [Deltaproteobacteria bacterium Smac51]
MNDKNYYWLIADGRIWGFKEARWLDRTEMPDEDMMVELRHNDQVAGLDYLRETIRFYGGDLGELATDKERAIEIKSELDALDAEYLTPRILANLAVGDEYALARKAEHEAKAAPLRHQLAGLEVAHEEKD